MQLSKLAKQKAIVPWLLFGATLIVFGIYLLSADSADIIKGLRRSSNQPTSNQQKDVGKAILGDSYPQKPENKESYRVSQVVDGDTIELEGGIRVRYIGIDTPEDGKPYYTEAKQKNADLVLGKSVVLEHDVTGKDRYGRDLAYVWVGDLFVNLELVATGHAAVYTIPPNVKYQDLLLAAQQKAIAAKIGLWGAEPIGTKLSGCPIKGNISQTGEKIYHMPGQDYYEKTHINESKGERWFCSEVEALGAGWRKSRK